MSGILGENSDWWVVAEGGAGRGREGFPAWHVASMQAGGHPGYECVSKGRCCGNYSLEFLFSFFNFVSSGPAHHASSLSFSSLAFWKLYIFFYFESPYPFPFPFPSRKFLVCLSHIFFFSFFNYFIFYAWEPYGGEFVWSLGLNFIRLMQMFNS